VWGESADARCRVVVPSRCRAVVAVAPIMPSWPSRPSRRRAPRARRAVVAVTPLAPSRPSRPSCRRGRHVVVSSRRHVVTPVVAVALSCRRARRWRHALPPVASLRRRERGRVTVALRAWARVVLPPPCVLNAEQEEMKKKRLTESCCRGLACAPRRRHAEPRARAPMSPSCHRRAACAPGLCGLYRKPSAPKNERKKLT